MAVKDLSREGRAEIVAPDDQAVAAEENSAFTCKGANREVVHSVRRQVELSISKQLNATSAAESVAQEFDVAASPTIRSASGGDGGVSGGRVSVSRTPAEGQESFSEVPGDRGSVDCNVTIAGARPTAKSDRSPNGVCYRARIDNQRGLGGRRVVFEVKNALQSELAIKRSAVCDESGVIRGRTIVQVDRATKAGFSGAIRRHHGIPQARTCLHVDLSVFEQSEIGIPRARGVGEAYDSASIAPANREAAIRCR